MNIRRGMLRLWVVIAVGWAALAGYQSWRHYAPLVGAEQDRPECVKSPPPPWCLFKTTEPRVGLTVALTTSAVIVAFPPLVLLVFGWLFGWIVKGFRSREV